VNIIIALRVPTKVHAIDNGRVPLDGEREFFVAQGGDSLRAREVDGV